MQQRCADVHILVSVSASLPSKFQNLVLRFPGFSGTKLIFQVLEILRAQFLDCAGGAVGTQPTEAVHASVLTCGPSGYSLAWPVLIIGIIIRVEIADVVVVLRSRSVQLHPCRSHLIPSTSPATSHYHFAGAAVAVDSSRMTASSSASWSRFTPPSNFVDGHMSTMWFMVCCWPQSQEGH